MYQNDPMKVLTGEVRLSYCNLTTPRAAKQGGEPKFSVTILIPKTDVSTKADIDAAIQAAAVKPSRSRPPAMPFIAIKPMPCARQPSTNASSCSPAR